MEKIKDLNIGGALAEKINELVQVVNGLKCVENEVPIYETLSHNDVLIISKNDEGLLVVSNRLGVVQLERVEYPKEEEEKQMNIKEVGGEKHGF